MGSHPSSSPSATPGSALSSMSTMPGGMPVLQTARAVRCRSTRGRARTAAAAHRSRRRSRRSRPTRRAVPSRPRPSRARRSDRAGSPRCRIVRRTVTAAPGARMSAPISTKASAASLVPAARSIVQAGQARIRSRIAASPSTVPTATMTSPAQQRELRAGRRDRLAVANDRPRSTIRSWCDTSRRRSWRPTRATSGVSSIHSIARPFDLLLDGRDGFGDPARAEEFRHRAGVGGRQLTSRGALVGVIGVVHEDLPPPVVVHEHPDVVAVSVVNSWRTPTPGNLVSRTRPSHHLASARGGQSTRLGAGRRPLPCCP